MIWLFKLRPIIVLLLLTLSVASLQADDPEEPIEASTPVADDAVVPAIEYAEEEDIESSSQVMQIANEEVLGGPEGTAETSQGDETTDAERISRLQRSIEKDKQQLDRLRAELKGAEEEFEKAGRIFNKVDERLNETKAELTEAEESGPPEKATELATALEDRKEKWALCKERFDLSIQAKKGLQQQISAVKEKIEQDAEALSKLSGTGESEAPAELPAGETSEPAKPAPVAASESKENADAPPQAEESKPSIGPMPPVTKSQAGIIANPSDSSDDDQESTDVRDARTEASRREAAASEARQAVAAIEKRQRSLDKSIEIEQQLRDAARKQADNALRALQEFQEDYRTKSEAGAPVEEILKLDQRIHSSEMRLEKARDEVKRRTERLDELQSQRHALLEDRISALEQAEARQIVADEARRKVQSLENPFSRRNLLRWAFRHGPNILVILVGFLVLRLVVRVVCRRVVVLMTHRGEGTRKERENRAETIVSVFHNAATVLCYGGSSLMVLEECGVPVGPLLGGAAVVGLAVAFGSQNLIRDYFYGFVILLENQYGINDIVKIGDITGQVERITLRMTVVRDMDGVNFIPNGRIESVKNLTHGWSRAVLDISVAYQEDLDRVMDVLMNLGRELRRDPNFADVILEDPTMLGVEQLGDSSVVIKMYLKTKPLEQWQVKREMLRRVKKRFEELAIEIPFPQRVVNHRYLPADGSAADEEATQRWQQRKSA